MNDDREAFERIESAWEGIPTDLVLLRRTDSTNRLARRVANELARDDVAIRPTLFLAWEQTAGRGRQGRSWISPPGLGIYATLLIPLSDADRGQALPLLTCVALCEILDSWSRGSCRVEWPNDLVIGGRKIGGILIESSISAGEGAGYAALGFGVNHGHEEEELPLPEATSIARESDEPPAWPDAVAALARNLCRWLDRTSSPEDVVERFRALSAHEAGESLTCRVGGDVVEGRFVRFTDRGFLVLETDDGERTLSAGEIAEP